MRFIDVQKKKWDEDTKKLDDYCKLGYYCNTKLLSYIGIEYQMTYSALNCRIKRLIKKLKLKNDWHNENIFNILNYNKDMFGNVSELSKFQIV